MNKQMLMESLSCGAWGTIGPHYTKVSLDVAKKCNGKFGVLIHSFSGAMETALRSLGIAHGDKVIVSAYSDRTDSEITSAIGAIPVFVDVESNGTISINEIKKAFSHNENIRAIILDLTDDLDINAIKSVCADNHCAVIINGGDQYSYKFNFDGIYAVVLDFGICGCVVTDTEENYVSLFAWHHCGHAPGTAASITFESIIGGDMRISEFQAIEVHELIEKNNVMIPVTNRGYVKAYLNPLFETDYFKKMTGHKDGYKAEDYPNAQKL